MYIAHIYWLMIVNYYLVSMSKSVGYCQSFNSIRSQICNCQYHFHWASSDQLSSAQLNRPNVGCTRAHALEWTSTWLLFAQSIAEFHWFWLIGRRIGTVLYSFWSNFVFFFIFLLSLSFDMIAKIMRDFLLVDWNFFYIITCYYEVIYSSAMENLVHSKEFRWCLGVKKTRAHTHNSWCGMK